MNRKIAAILCLFVSIPTQGAMDFDGSDTLLNFGDKTAFEFASGQSFSITFWFKATGVASQQGMLSKTYGSTDGEVRPWYLIRWNVGGSSGRIDFLIRDGAGNNCFAVGTTNYGDSRWHFYTGRYNADTNIIQVIVDTVVDGSASSCADAAYGTQSGSLIFGNHTTGWYDGDLDDLRIYNRALTDQEIETLYRSRSRLSVTDGLVGWWSLDDGIDGAVASGANSARDISGNGNHGTATGGPIFEASEWINYP